jgi:sugar phosphate isomerase/epimerase
MEPLSNKTLARREFFKLGAAGIAVAGAALPLERLSQARPAIKASVPIALQLYSVRNDCAKDLPGTIAAVGKMGYSGVEFAGYYNRSAKELRKMLDDNRLKCCGTHIGLETLLGDNLAKTIEFNQTLGNKFLIVPSLDEERTKSRQAWLETARIFNELAKKVEPHGVRVGYHNHQIEFKPLDGELPWDTFFGHTKKEVVMQVDIGNALEGGGNPIPFLKKYPGRAATVHIKEYSKTKPNAYIGEGDVKWKEVFDLLEKSGGTEWYIVEYEIEGMPPLDSVNRCLQNLRKMGK